MLKWIDELPWRGNRDFHRWPLLLEYSAWTMAFGLFIGAIAAKAELDYGGSRVIDNPWYPSILLALYGTVFPLSFILPMMGVNVARAVWAGVRRMRDDDFQGAICAMRGTARTDGWTWFFECLITAMLTGLLHAAMVGYGDRIANGPIILEWGTRGFVLALLPMALVFARRLVVIGRRAWRDRAI